MADIAVEYKDPAGQIRTVEHRDVEVRFDRDWCFVQPRYGSELQLPPHEWIRVSDLASSEELSRNPRA